MERVKSYIVYILHKLSFIEPNVTKEIIKSFVILKDKHPMEDVGLIKNM